MEKRFNLKLDKVLYKWLKKKAQKLDISMAEMVRRILLVERQMDLSPSRGDFIKLLNQDESLKVLIPKGKRDN